VHRHWPAGGPPQGLGEVLRGLCGRFEKRSRLCATTVWIWLEPVSRDGRRRSR
jgi:hypothetical protein